jgi:hypothetical protein
VFDAVDPIYNRRDRLLPFGKRWVVLLKHYVNSAVTFIDVAGVGPARPGGG